MSSHYSNKCSKEATLLSVDRITSAKRTTQADSQQGTKRNFKRISDKGITHSMWTIRLFPRLGKTQVKTSLLLTRRAKNSMKKSWRTESLSIQVSSPTPSRLSTYLVSLSSAKFSVEPGLSAKKEFRKSSHKFLMVVAQTSPRFSLAQSTLWRWRSATKLSAFASGQSNFWSLSPIQFQVWSSAQARQARSKALQTPSSRFSSRSLATTYRSFVCTLRTQS